MTLGPLFSLDGVSVFIGMPAREDIPVPTASSLLATISWLDRHDVPYYSSVVGGGTICSARCQIAKAFLEGDFTTLVYIDSDMVWQPQEFVRLLTLSTKMDIVAGAYQGRFDPPHFYMKAPDDVPGPEKLEVNEFGCIKMDGIGMGFTAVSRRVMEKLAKKAPTIKYRDDDILPEIFRFGKDKDDNFQGEDMIFFEDARRAGFQLWVDPRIRLGHLGQKIYNASLNDKPPEPVRNAQNSAA